MDVLVFCVLIVSVFLVGAYGVIWNNQHYTESVDRMFARSLDEHATELQILKDYLGIEADFENAEPGKVLISYTRKEAA